MLWGCLIVDELEITDVKAGGRIDFANSKFSSVNTDTNVVVSDEPEF